MPRNLGFACTANDYALGVCKSWVSPDPTDALIELIDWRNLSWTPQPQHAQIFNTTIQVYQPSGNMTLTVWATFDGNTQRYEIVMVPR